MYVVTVEFEVKTEHLDAFLSAVRGQAKNSLEHEQACRRFDVCLARDDPSQVFLYEIYDDEAAFDTHLATRHYAEFSRVVDAWICDKRVRRWETS